MTPILFFNYYIVLKCLFTFFEKYLSYLKKNFIVHFVYVLEVQTIDVSDLITRNVTITNDFALDVQLLSR